MVEDAGRSGAEASPTEASAAVAHGKDPAEQEALARDLGEELTDAFAGFVRGEIDFAALSFLAFETLQDLYVIASGAYELEYEDDADDASTADYDEERAAEQQEELAQESAER